VWHLRRVVGESMEPTLKKGRLLIISRVRDYKIGDVVVVLKDNREVVKRITDYVDGRVFLQGDNAEMSTDSRIYGWVVDRHIQGKVIWPSTKTT